MQFSLGEMNEAEVLDAVEFTFVIVFLMLSILSEKKFINSLSNCEEIFRSGVKDHKCYSMFDLNSRPD